MIFLSCHAAHTDKVNSTKLWPKIVEVESSTYTKTLLGNNILNAREGGKTLTGRQSKSSCFFCFEANGHLVPLWPAQYNRHLPKGWEVMQSSSIPGDWVTTSTTLFQILPESLSVNERQGVEARRLVTPQVHLLRDSRVFCFQSQQSSIGKLFIWKHCFNNLAKWVEINLSIA